MPLKTPELEEPTINLTSMLDVVLLLVYFFMVGAQFSSDERQYDIQVPTVAEALPLTEQPDEIVVNLTAEGVISVSNQILSLPALEEALTLARENYPNQLVVIRGAGEGRYQPVMDVMSTCRKAGIRSISLAHRPLGEAP